MDRRALSAGTGAAEYIACPSRGPSVRIRRDAARGIDAEARAGLNALPRRGAEIGGILLGWRTPATATIESFVAVESEHRYGPSYLLSEKDIEKLATVVSDKYNGLEVIGYYRSHTRPQFAPDSHDLEMIDRLFPNRKALFLLVRPSKSGAAEAALYTRGVDGLEALGNASPFPFTATARPSPSEGAQPEAQAESEAGAATQPNPLTERPEAIQESEDSGEPEVTADAKFTEVQPPDSNFTPNEPGLQLSDWYASDAEAQPAHEDTTEQPVAEQRVPVWVLVLLAAALTALGAIFGYLSVSAR